MGRSARLVETERRGDQGSEGPDAGGLACLVALLALFGLPCRDPAFKHSAWHVPKASDIELFMAAATSVLLADRRVYPIWARDLVRYCDTDRQGHLNNAVFATFLETGRAQFLLNHPDGSFAPRDRYFVIARLVVDFRAELNWPGEVEIGTVVLAAGRSSITFGQGIFHGGMCAATAESVVVLIDAVNRRAAPLPESARQRLAPYGLNRIDPGVVDG